MSVTLSLFAGAGWQLFNNNGVPLAGGLIYTYAAGTTTPEATYTSSAGTIAQSNPIVLNSAGRVSVGEVWVSEGVSYKFVLKDSTGTTIGTYDNLNGTYVAGDLANTTNPALGDALVGFRQSNSSGNLTGAVGRTVHQKLQESVSVLDFGADPTGVADSYPAFQAAHDSFGPSTGYPAGYYGGEILVPFGKYYLSQTFEISKSIILRGVGMGSVSFDSSPSELVFAANTTGILLNSNLTAATSAGGTVIENLVLSAPTTMGTTGYGVLSHATFYMKNVAIRYFSSHGIYVDGRTGVTGNADGWKLYAVQVSECGGDGLRLIGDDANIGTAIGVQCLENGGWGFFDEAAYSNTYINPQSAGNAGGAYHSSGNAVYINPYTEYQVGQPYVSDLGDQSLVFGGTSQQTAANSFYGLTGNGLVWNVKPSRRHLFYRDGVEIGRIETTNILEGLKGASFTPAVGRLITLGTVGESVIRIVVDTTGSNDCMRFDNPNGRVGDITTSGSTTAFNTSSDYRLKENVLPMTGALDTVAKLNPVTFNWKCDGKDGQGFIAHELQAVVPDCVTGEKDAVDAEGKMITQSVDASFLIATLTKAIQELSAKVAALEK